MQNKQRFSVLNVLVTGLTTALVVCVVWGFFRLIGITPTIHYPWLSPDGQLIRIGVSRFVADLIGFPIMTMMIAGLCRDDKEKNGEVGGGASTGLVAGIIGGAIAALVFHLTSSPTATVHLNLAEPLAIWIALGIVVDIVVVWVMIVVSALGSGASKQLISATHAGVWMGIGVCIGGAAALVPMLLLYLIVLLIGKS